MAAGSPLNTESKSEAQTIRYFGDYELLGEIASGGMGKVYLARQVSLKRTVALKMIRSGELATEAEVQRFRTEAEAAASLDHPNIVPIYEIGEHEGQHYFSMKLIEGGHLGELNASQTNRDATWLKRAVKLMATILRAVHHAHQRGVLHRDIKPTNILLDDQGEPHLTDFGLAKLAQTGRDLTQTIAVLGTPHYMAPEQATGKVREVTVAADIYGLGAVLFELVAGRTVFQGESALEVLKKAQELDAPSLRKLNPAVDRDLETVCLKCLEKAPNRRYDTTEEFADDLDHWLAGEPIQARPVGTPERVLKWAQRNPAVATLVVLAHVLFVAGIIGVLWQWRRAEAAAERAVLNAQEAETNAGQARAEANKATAVSEFLQQMLRSANPEDVKGSQYTVREMLDDFSAGLGTQFEDQPEVEAALRTIIGKAYWRLGRPEQSRQNLERALALNRLIHGDKHEAVAQSLIDCAWSLIESHEFDEADALARKALDICHQLDSPPELRIAGLSTRVRIAVGQSRHADVEALAEETLALARSRPDEAYPQIPSVMHQLAEAKVAQGKYVEAEPLARQAIALHRQTQGDKHPETAWALICLGRALERQGKAEAAITNYVEARQIFQFNYADDHWSLQSAADSLRPALQTLHQWSELEALEHEELDRNIKVYGEEHLEVARSLDRLADVLRERGQLPEAEQYAREGVAMRRKILVNDDSQNWQSLESMLKVLSAQGKQDQVMSLGKEEAERLLATQGESANPDLGFYYRLLGTILTSGGEQELAEDVIREELQIFDRASEHSAQNQQFRQEVAYSHCQLADLLLRKERQNEALTNYLSALALYEALKAESPGNGFYHQEVAHSTWMVAGVIEQMRGFDDALPEYERALSLHKQGMIDFPENKWFAPRAGAICEHLCNVFSRLERWAEAERMARERLAIMRQHVGEVSRETDNALVALANLLYQHGDFEAALPIRREELALEIKLSGNEHLWVANSLAMLGNTLLKLRGLDEAEQSFRECVRIRRKLAPRSPDAANAMLSLAMVLEEMDRTEEAQTFLEESLSIRRQAGVPAVTNTANSLAWFSLRFLRSGRFRAAESPARECLAIREKLLPDHWLRFNAESLLGGSLLGQRKYAEAEPHLLAGYEGMKQREATIPPNGKPRLRETVERLANLYAETKRPEEAEKWKQMLTEYPADPVDE